MRREGRWSDDLVEHRITLTFYGLVVLWVVTILMCLMAGLDFGDLTARIEKLEGAAGATEASGDSNAEGPGSNPGRPATKK